MQEPPIPTDEQERLKTLRGLNILDTSAEERFDRLTRVAKRTFQVPIALVSLVDENRQWFKSCQGLPVSETPRTISFCGHTIIGDDIFHVPDTFLDDRFADNPLVTGEPFIRFYAGCPLRAPNGHKMGTLCIIDTEPRHFDNEDLRILHDLAHMAEQELAALTLASLDELTGLSNRRGFEVLSQQSLDLCRRLNRPATLLFFDLDDFKGINDTYGHAEGDHALRLFSQSLLDTFRESDVLARLGGDEFVILITGTAQQEVETMLSRLDQQLTRQQQENPLHYAISYSVGTVAYQHTQHITICDLMKVADKLMYAQKSQRRTETKGQASA